MTAECTQVGFEFHSLNHRHAGGGQAHGDHPQVRRLLYRLSRSGTDQMHGSDRVS